MTAALAIVPAQQPLETLIDAVVSTMRSEHSRRAYGQSPHPLHGSENSGFRGVTGPI